MATNAARNYIATSVDGIITTPAVIDNIVWFNPKTNQYEGINDDTTPSDVYEVAEAERVNLQLVISRFPHSDNYQCENWSDVEKAMSDAVTAKGDRHNATSKDVINKIIQKIGRSGTALQSWMDLLPNSEYSSVICGASKLVVMAITRHATIQEAVAMSLAEIPLALESARENLAVSKCYQSLRLHQAFSKLCAAIFVSYRHMLVWLEKGTMRHAAAAFFRQDSYGQEVIQSIEAVRIQSAEVRRETKVCSYIRLGKIDQTLSRHIYRVDGMKLTVEGMKIGIEKIIPQLETMTTLHEENSRTISKLDTNTTMILDVLQAFSKLLAADIPFMLHRRSVASQLDFQNEQDITVPVLLRLLQYDISSIQADTAHAIGLRHNMSDVAKRRAENFLSHDRFKTWHEALSSEFLLVNGNEEPDGTLSSTTLSCGMLATSLGGLDRAISLIYFGGFHPDGNNELSCSGPELMMASLVCQLLAAHNWEGDEASVFRSMFGGGQYSLEDLAKHRVGGMCRFFGDLVRRLPKGKVVFMIIDDIRFFEFHAPTHLLEVIRLLLDVRQNRKSGVVFKVLLTHATRARVVQDVIPVGDTLDMPAEIDYDDGEFHVGRQIFQDGDFFRRSNT